MHPTRDGPPGRRPNKIRPVLKILIHPLVRSCRPKIFTTGFPGLHSTFQRLKTFFDLFDQRACFFPQWTSRPMTIIRLIPGPRDSSLHHMRKKWRMLLTKFFARPRTKIMTSRVLREDLLCCNNLKIVLNVKKVHFIFAWLEILAWENHSFVIGLLTDLSTPVLCASKAFNCIYWP